MNDRFRDQVVLITGGAQGLGLATARRFVAEGAVVHIADVNGEAAEQAAAGLDRTGPHAVVAHSVDVTDEAAVNAWVDSAERVDVMINNAGIIRDNRIERITAEDWHAVLAVSLTGSFYCARAAMTRMKQHNYGRIVSFSSMSWRGNFGQANYVAAKAGIVGLTRTIALEGARHGITANAIAPGLIRTPMLASMNGPAREKLISKVPIGAPGEPEDIAAAVCFLASREAHYITGVVLDVDGGLGIGSSIR